MKLTKVISSLRSKIETSKMIKHENNIQKHFQVHDHTLYGDAGKQLHDAREVVSRFAERNGVSVDVYDARRLLDNDEHVSPIIENKFSDKLHIVVTNLLNGKLNERIIGGNTDIVYPKVKSYPIILPVKGEDTDIIRRANWSTEDTFLRNFYRNVEEMVKEVTKPVQK